MTAHQRGLRRLLKIGCCSSHVGVKWPTEGQDHILPRLYRNGCFPILGYKEPFRRLCFTLQNSFVWFVAHLIPQTVALHFSQNLCCPRKKGTAKSMCPNLLCPIFCHNLKGHDGKTMVSGFDFPPSPFLTSALGAHQARGWDPGGRGHQPGSMETPEDRQRSGPSGSGVGDGCCQWMVNGEWMC